MFFNIFPLTRNYISINLVVYSNQFSISKSKSLRINFRSCSSNKYKKIVKNFVKNILMNNIENINNNTLMKI